LVGGCAKKWPPDWAALLTQKPEGISKKQLVDNQFSTMIRFSLLIWLLESLSK
jgi:hypothetical protein